MVGQGGISVWMDKVEEGSRAPDVVCVWGACVGVLVVGWVEGGWCCGVREEETV